MAGTFSSLDKQIAEAEKSVRLIAERKFEYPQTKTNLSLANDMPTMAFDVDQQG